MAYARATAIAALFTCVVCAAAAADAPNIQAVGDDLVLAAGAGSVSVQKDLIPVIGLAAAVNGIVADIAGTKSEREDLRDQIKVLKGRLDTLESEDLEATLMAILSNITGTQAQQYDRLNEYVANVQDDVAANTQSVSKIMQLIAQLNITVGNAAVANDRSKRSCRELWEAGARTDGTYTVNPSAKGEIKVYCDMANGGWTLIGMMHTVNKPVNEPSTFFVDGYQKFATQLQTNTNAHGYAPMGLGASLFEDYLHARNEAAKSDASKKPLARVVILAHDKISVTNTWYKDLSEPRAFTTLFLKDNQGFRTQACRNEAMTKACFENYIGQTQDQGGFTNFLGMYVEYNGVTAGNPIHTRMNTDGAGVRVSGVCSSTGARGNEDSSGWPDSAFDGHWGNGLRIWLR